MQLGKTGKKQASWSVLVLNIDCKHSNQKCTDERGTYEICCKALV